MKPSRRGLLYTIGQALLRVNLHAECAEVKEYVADGQDQTGTRDTERYYDLEDESLFVHHDASEDDLDDAGGEGVQGIAI